VKEGVAPTLSSKPNFAENSKFRDVPKTTLRLTDLLKVEPKKEQTATEEAQKQPDLSFTVEQLQLHWNEFAEQRKKFQAEYQLLTQPLEMIENKIILHLHNPVQESMLNNLKIDLINFLRERLRNQSIQIVGELRAADERKVIYTNREKFDYLAQKNPMLKELKERLGLDTDF
jgi:hypothetical protein